MEHLFIAISAFLYGTSSKNEKKGIERSVKKSLIRPFLLILGIAGILAAVVGMGGLLFPTADSNMSPRVAKVEYEKNFSSSLTLLIFNFSVGCAALIGARSLGD